MYCILYRTCMHTVHLLDLQYTHDLCLMQFVVIVVVVARVNRHEQVNVLERTVALAGDQLTQTLALDRVVASALKVRQKDS